MQAKQAIWEPCHGNFRFCHPWAEYVKVGTAIRQCALAVLTLDGCLHSGMPVSTFFPLLPKPSTIVHFTEVYFYCKLCWYIRPKLHDSKLTLTIIEIGLQYPNLTYLSKLKGPRVGTEKHQDLHCGTLWCRWHLPQSLPRSGWRWSSQFWRRRSWWKSWVITSAISKNAERSRW